MAANTWSNFEKSNTPSCGSPNSPCGLGNAYNGNTANLSSFAHPYPACHKAYIHHNRQLHTIHYQTYAVKTALVHRKKKNKYEIIFLHE